VRKNGVAGGETYRIQSIGTQVTLIVCDMFDTKTDIILNVQMLAFIDVWSVYSGKLPCVLPDVPSPVYSQLLETDVIKTKVFTALMCHERAAGDRSLQFGLYPSCVFASGAIAKGELKLAPLTSMSGISADVKKGGVTVNVGKHSTMSLSGPPKASKAEDSTDAKYAFVPYWWAESTPDEAKANMKLVSVKGEDNVVFPAFQNTCTLSTHDKLLIFKPKAVKTALKDVQMQRIKPEEQQSKKARAK
jgi:hypothetical protein